MILTMNTDDTEEDRERDGEGVCSPSRSSCNAKKLKQFCYTQDLPLISCQSIIHF